MYNFSDTKTEAGKKMESEWMGRYREIVAAVVRHGNVVLRTQNNSRDIGNGVVLKQQSWQILEYIVEHDNKRFSMNDISYQLNIPQSTFSRTVKMLCEEGLVEKYQMINNRKNIILKPTEKGIELYRIIAGNSVEPIFRDFFEALKDVSDEDLHRVAVAIEKLDNNLIPERNEEIEMIRLEK